MCFRITLFNTSVFPPISIEHNPVLDLLIVPTGLRTLPGVGIRKSKDRRAGASLPNTKIRNCLSLNYVLCSISKHLSTKYLKFTWLYSKLISKAFTDVHSLFSSFQCSSCSTTSFALYVRDKIFKLSSALNLNIK